MRIGTRHAQLEMTRILQQRQAELAHTQQQLGAGKTLLQPGDDPQAAAQVLRLQAVEAAHQRHLDTISRTASRLVLEEDALAGAADVVASAKALAIGAINGSRNAADRASVAADIREHRDELLALANRRDAEGEADKPYLFVHAKKGEWKVLHNPL